MTSELRAECYRLLALFEAGDTLRQPYLLVDLAACLRAHGEALDGTTVGIAALRGVLDATETERDALRARLSAAEASIATTAAHDEAAP